MKTGYEKKTIKLSQIVNRDMARYRVLFKSPDEVSDPETWKKILSNYAGGRRFEIIVHDDTPDEICENSKKYSILYGLKRLYAAEKMEMAEITVKVVPPSDPFDMHVATCFFNADFVSMSPFERGEFLEGMEERFGLSFDYIARNSGFSFNTLNSVRSAYHDSQRILTLRNAYKDGLIPMNLVVSMRKYYEMTPFSDHKNLTEFIIKNRFRAVEIIDRAVKTRETDVTVPQAIRREIFQKEGQIREETTPSILDLLVKSLQEDNILPAGDISPRRAERIMQEKKLGTQMKMYLTAREKTYAAYSKLVSVLPQDLILDYETSLLLPDKSKFSYALPKDMGKYATIPKNKNEKRLLVRIIEYTEAALKDGTSPLRIRTAMNLFKDIRAQNAFVLFFRNSIRFRNMKEKILMMRK